MPGVPVWRGLCALLLLVLVATTHARNAQFDENDLSSLSPLQSTLASLDSQLPSDSMLDETLLQSENALNEQASASIIGDSIGSTLSGISSQLTALQGSSAEYSLPASSASVASESSYPNMHSGSASGEEMRAVKLPFRTERFFTLLGMREDTSSGSSAIATAAAKKNGTEWRIYVSDSHDDTPLWVRFDTKTNRFNWSRGTRTGVIADNITARLLRGLSVWDDLSVGTSSDPQWAGRNLSAGNDMVLRTLRYALSLPENNRSSCIPYALIVDRIKAMPFGTRFLKFFADIQHTVPVIQHEFLMEDVVRAVDIAANHGTVYTDDVLHLIQEYSRMRASHAQSLNSAVQYVADFMLFAKRFLTLSVPSSPSAYNTKNNTSLSLSARQSRLLSFLNSEVKPHCLSPSFLSMRDSIASTRVGLSLFKDGRVEGDLRFVGALMVGGAVLEGIQDFKKLGAMDAAASLLNAITANAEVDEKHAPHYENPLIQLASLILPSPHKMSTFMRGGPATLLSAGQSLFKGRLDELKALRQRIAKQDLGTFALEITSDLKWFEAHGEEIWDAVKHGIREWYQDPAPKPIDYLPST